MDEAEGEIAIETSAAPPTVDVVEFEIDPSVAEMLADPNAALVANPALLMTATVLDEEAHIAVDVTSCMLPSV
jgi:hypothetical protein